MMALMMALLLPLAAGAPARAQGAMEGARAPNAVATEFYGWYLDTLGADQDPLSDRYDTFTRYVARELAARLVERLRGGKLPQRDYFIQSASYRPAWRRGVRAAVLRRRAGVAEVLVTLGNGGAGADARADEGGPRQVLVLSMIVEGGAWKIRQVAALDAAANSFEPPAT